MLLDIRNKESSVYNDPCKIILKPLYVKYEKKNMKSTYYKK